MPSISACGNLPYANVTLQWAKTTETVDNALAQLQRFGARVELRSAPGLSGRWHVMRELIASNNPDSLLDVGGFGQYADTTARSRCINIHHHAGCQVYHPGTRLPYRDDRFSTVLLETVLHHAAEHTLQLLKETARVASRHVIIAEDILDRRASPSVVRAYRTHDPWAVYRSTGEWISLARDRGLVLERIVALDRVPLHVAREARPACVLDYPPMQYMVFRVAQKV